MIEITEEQAIQDVLDNIKEFKSKYGQKALEAAIINGAFHIHPDYGDLTYVFKYREFNYNVIDIPVWVTDMYANADQFAEDMI